LRAREWPGVQVIHMIGAAGRGDPLIDGRELARHLAHTLSTRYHTLNAPLIIDDPSIRQALMKKRFMREILALADQFNIALVAIGNAEPDISSLVRAGRVQAKEGLSTKAACLWRRLASPLTAPGNLIVEGTANGSTLFACPIQAALQLRLLCWHPRRIHRRLHHERILPSQALPQS
jgi:hypothetical protein